MHFPRLFFSLLAVNALLFAGHPNEAICSAAEPGWTHGVLLFGDAKAKKDATPILERQYRPFHFYGNTLRRQYYRGNVRPSVSDVFQASKAVITRT